ncbi:MAG: histidine kinase [Bacteroidales bacterium]|nr:histidine kinase [Bacteroidales bacterium]
MRSVLAALPLLFILFMNPVRSQEPFFFHYTTVNGLPATEIYDLAQDSIGQLWLATGSGVIVYDGYAFKNLVTPPEISDNSLIKMFTGKNEKFWFLSFSGDLVYTDHGNLKPYPLNDTIQALGSTYFLTCLFVDTLDRIFFTSKKKGKLIIIDPEKGIQEIDSTSYPKRIYTPFFINTTEAFPMQIVSAEIYNSYQENDSTCWHRLNNGGVEISEPNDPPRIYFRNSRITRVLKDRELHYWIATEGNGLLYLPSIQMEIFCPPKPYENTNIITFCLAGDHCYYSTADGKLFLAHCENGQMTNSIEILEKEASKFIRSILVSKQGSLWLTQSNYLRYQKDGTKNPPRHIVLLKYYDIFQASDRDILIASREGFITYRGPEIIYDSRQDQFYKHTRTILERQNGEVFLGTMEGLYLYQNGNYTNLTTLHPMLMKPIEVLREWNQRLVIGTAAAGIAILNPDQSILQLTLEQGLPSLQIKDIYCDNDSVLWIGSNQGLTKATLTSTGIWDIQNITIWDGLPSPEIHKIERQGEFLWMATANGMASFIPEKLHQQLTDPTIYIDRLIINDRDTVIPTNSILILNPDQHTLSIYYKGVHFSGHDQLEYEYRLLGKDSSWITTHNLSVRFPDLSPGSYVFEVRARLGADNPSGKIARMQFSRTPYFNETWFFFLAVALLASLVFAGIILLIVKQIERRTRFKTDYLWMQQKALRLQMNPHFIFNSLNSVQHFILNKEEEAAGLYLSSFSKLMRRVLENSMHNLIPLDEELETIELYLLLEKVRFEDTFEFQLTVDKDLQTSEVKIPPMLIQPFLENAIRHGLANKPTKGTLSLQFSRAGKMVKITLEDDGIGMKASSEINARRQGHRSSGMKNIEERIDMLNQLLDQMIRLQITDLSDTNPVKTGTRVELFIPFFSSSESRPFPKTLFRWLKR